MPQRFFYYQIEDIIDHGHQKNHKLFLKLK